MTDKSDAVTTIYWGQVKLEKTTTKFLESSCTQHI